VGEAAKNQASRNARGTIYDAKRLIGRLAADKTVKADAERWPAAGVVRVLGARRGAAFIGPSRSSRARTARR